VTPAPDFLDHRLTERRNPRTVGLDVATPLELVDLLNAEDQTVPTAVHAVRGVVAAVMERIAAAFRAGGRLLYVGAGTSGRLGVLDAAECPPTFGTPPEMVVGILAGGPEAFGRSREGAEDDAKAGAGVMDDHAVTDRDVVIGIAASGTTPYVHGALQRARALGAVTALVTCADPPETLAAVCEHVIVVRVGPEALTGSTRLKAGTATKLVLNTLTTGAMVLLGKAYGNLMVDLQVLSSKLQDRGERIVMEVGKVDRARARAALAEAEGSVKLAIVMARRHVSASDARRLLTDAEGIVRRVIGNPPPVSS
jgi:N-acetylmuramic acid 6-phosphate etherase